MVMGITFDSWRVVGFETGVYYPKENRTFKGTLAFLIYEAKVISKVDKNK